MRFWPPGWTSATFFGRSFSSEGVTKGATKDEGRSFGSGTGCFRGGTASWAAGFGFSSSTQCVRPPFTKRAGSNERSSIVVYCVYPLLFAICWNQTCNERHATGQKENTPDNKWLAATAGQWDEIG